MSKWLKLFKKGKYPQGDFTGNKFTELVKNTENTTGEAVYYHTSKTKGKTPDLGEFEFKSRGNWIIGRPKLNGKATSMIKDGFIDRVSVEIDRVKNRIKRVGLLPAGVEAAVKDSDRLATLNFEELETLEFEAIEIEFEEIEEVEEIVDFGKLLAWMAANNMTMDQITKVMNQLKAQVTDKQNIRKLTSEFSAEAGFEVIEKPEIKELNEEELRAKHRAEFAAEEAGKASLDELKEKNKFKIIPANTAEFEALAQALFTADSTAEFEEGNGAVEFEDSNKKKVQKGLLESFTNIMSGVAEFQHGPSDFEFNDNEGGNGANNSFEKGVEIAKSAFGLE